MVKENAVQDTVALLQECDSGTKMAVKSLRQVLDNTASEKLNALLSHSLQEHEKLGNDLHALLNEYGEPDKEPPVMGTINSWVTTSMKMMVNNTDQQIASLMTDGCHMGLKSLSKYVNQYTDASSQALDMCTRLIKMEQDLTDKLRAFL